MVYRDSPTSEEALVVAFASIFPDIIDRPLAWEFDVFANGHALARSIFFAITVSIVVVLLASLRGRPRIGWEFEIGYLFYLPADIVPKHLLDGEHPLDRMLWPVAHEGGQNESGFQDEFMDNIIEYTSWWANR